MPRSSSSLVAACAAALVVAVPAAHARSFTVSKAGTRPSIAVDAGGLTHIVWDTVAADRTSTTHYCQVPRKASGCAAGTERTFVPAPTDQDFAGPRLFLAGPDVVVVTSRCCTSQEAPDGSFHSTRVFAMTSADRGATFSAPAWIGTQDADVGAAYANGAFLAFGIGAGGTALQAAPLGGYSGSANNVTTKLALSGGVGVSSKGSIVAFNDRNTVFAGAIAGDPNSTPIAFTKVGKGDSTVVTSGPRGADVMYRTKGSNPRFVIRRFAKGKAGRLSAVTEAGYPIFANAFQDGAGRVHAVWQGRLGLTYRRSGKTGRGFGRFTRLSRRSGYFHLVVAANGKGRAAMAYDSNGPGRVGGFTAG